LRQSFDKVASNHWRRESSGSAWPAPGGLRGVVPADGRESVLRSHIVPDNHQRFPRHRGSVRLFQIVELAPHMRPTRGLIDALIFVELIESGVGIGLQRPRNFSRCRSGCSPLRSGE